MSKSQTQSKAQSKTETNYVVVDFMDLETRHFSFLECKENSHGGHYIPIRYQGKSLFVRYPAGTCPFGVSTSTDNKDEYRGKYPDGKKITGYSTAISFKKEYENDPLYLKAQELDEFFIDKCVENSMAWCLGGSKTRPIARESVEGYDDRGWNGKWKRLVKWSYKVLPNKEREYKPYPPRMEFGIPTSSTTETQGENGLIEQQAIFKTVFFNADGDRLAPVHSTEVGDVLPNFSRVSTMAQWSSITQGTYGASLKPKAQQFRVYPGEGLPNTDECMLDNEDGEDIDIPDMLGGAPEVVVNKPKPVAAASAAVENVYEEVVEDVVEDVVEEVEAEPEPEPAPAPVRTTVRPRRTTRVVQARN